MLIELLRQTAAGAPEHPAVISPSRSWSYPELVNAAEALGQGLATRGIARFGIALDEPGDIVALLAAASATGSEPCVYPRELEDEEVAKLASRFGHSIVVTRGRPGLGGIPGLSPEELSGESGEPTPLPDESPVLILTTGTTGDQKGARHNWARLLQAVRHPDETPGARWLLAYNLNQFAGIQVLLHVLASGATLVAPPSSQARDVIQTMRETGVTHLSATPTFWRLLVGGLDADAARSLSLTQITLGGEATPERLIARLRELFPDARISHVYAGTEFGSVVSVRDGHAGLPLSVLDRPEDADARLRIVDGELQIRSRVGMLGYHHAQAAADEWHPTGDLVEVRDERIHFVGRTTEIINVGGAKVHPLPIEELVGAVDGVALAAVYGQPNPITGQIVALDVVVEAGADTEQVEQHIRAACEVLPRPGRPRRIRFVESLEVRGSKLMRREAGARA